MDYDNINDAINAVARARVEWAKNNEIFSYLGQCMSKLLSAKERMANAKRREIVKAVQSK